MSRVVIKDACLRDASYVMGNLNPDDLAEVACQLPQGMSPQHLALHHVALPKSAIAYFEGAPAMFFGVGALNAATASVWAVGTKHSWRTVPAVTRYWHEVLVPWGVSVGFQRAEARTLASHEKAHRWLRSLGGETDGVPFPFGTAGEPFLIYRFTVAKYRTIYGGDFPEVSSHVPV